MRGWQRRTLLSKASKSNVTQQAGQQEQSYTDLCASGTGQHWFEVTSRYVLLSFVSLPAPENYSYLLFGNGELVF